MVEAPEPNVRIPVSRANFYPHGTIETPIVELDVEDVYVTTDVVEMGRITVSVSKRTAEDCGADHVEIDLAPAAALLLAADILAAVARMTAQRQGEGPALRSAEVARTGRRWTN